MENTGRDIQGPKQQVLELNCKYVFVYSYITYNFTWLINLQEDYMQKQATLEYDNKGVSMSVHHQIKRTSITTIYDKLLFLKCSLIWSKEVKIV